MQEIEDRSTIAMLKFYVYRIIVFVLDVSSNIVV